MTLKEIRQTARLTQQDLSNRSGLCTSTICQIERGQVEPTTKQKRMILQGLGCHPDLINWELIREEYLKRLHS